MGHGQWFWEWVVTKGFDSSFLTSECRSQMWGFTTEHSAEGFTEENSSSKWAYTWEQKSLSFRTDRENSRKKGEWPVLILSGYSGFISVEVRDSGDQLSAFKSLRASVPQYHMTKELFWPCPTFPATWLWSYRKTVDIWRLVPAASQQPQDIHRENYKTSRHLRELWIIRNMPSEPHGQHRIRCQLKMTKEWSKMSQDSVAKENTL